MKKAIAYVSDVILGRTGEVISRDMQREMIRQHAAENGIEVVAWFEDELYSEEILSRPGIRTLLDASDGVDCVLVERVWALSRSWRVLEGFLGELKTRNVRLESVALLWDCVSQMARHWDKGTTLSSFPATRTVAAPVREPVRVRVARPLHAHFLGLVQRTRHA